MKSNKQLKSYIMKNFILFSVAIMLISNVLDTVMSGALEMVGTHYQLIENDSMEAIQSGAKYLTITVIVIFLLLQLSVLWFFVKMFGKIINKRISIPVGKLAEGLKEITQGDLSTRLDFETENEFVDIRDSFNHMAIAMEDAQAVKKTLESERSLLFSSIAHDLKTPITVITGYSKSLSDGMVTNQQKHKEYLSAIYAKSQQMNDMLDMLFSYAKLGNEQYVFSYENIDIIELIRTGLALSYTEFEDNAISLKLDLPEEAVIKRVDRFEMNRAITNLLTNVIKHNPKGITGLVKVENAQRLKIIVADNGNVIPEVIVSRLFDPFVLGDASRSSRGGSGLGLAITKKIIERHGGEIYLDTNYPGYTKAFVIYL